MNPHNYTALDFETATSENNSICQIGLVVLNNGIITKKYESLVQPPGNEYLFHNIRVHKIELNTSISKRTNFVVIGNNPGPAKMVKIEKLNIPVISEKEFLKMLEE